MQDITRIRKQYGDELDEDVYAFVETAYDNRVITHETAIMGRELGKGRLAVVKETQLKEKKKVEMVAAKMLLSKNLSTHFMYLNSKEVTSHFSPE